MTTVSTTVLHPLMVAWVVGWISFGESYFGGMDWRLDEVAHRACQSVAGVCQGGKDCLVMQTAKHTGCLMVRE